MADQNDLILELLQAIMKRQDTLVDEVSELKVAVAVDVQVSAQHRDKSEARFDSIEATLRDDIKPQTDDFRRMKTVGLGIVGLIAMGGFTVGGFIVWAGDVAVNWIRQWLRISG